MLGLFKRVFGRREDTSLVDRYTKELTEITGSIHALEAKSSDNEARVKHLQRQLTFYGVAFCVLRVSYVMVNSGVHTLYDRTVLLNVVVCMLGVVCAKLGLGRVDEYVRHRRIVRIDELRSQHAARLEAFKKDTDFNLTSSIIKRFSSGANESDDIVLLLDDEIRGKYEELDDLKTELIALEKNDKLKDAKERDKWFDKIINSLAGDSDLGHRYAAIQCGKCQQFTGCYRLAGGPLHYKCANCDEVIEEPATTTGSG
ncbi:hypothetical protein TPHA_0L00300 [Tetrapisispora phaffii CBS 4417]|uniref:Lunapark zinc ribbon domain-containing protein n=1 Tax=Tetrapisispora phaffii (strain ATCC 24235 / CBS 4417 / NBRC 1672 / NRRL Y-8282 / UCD 70-5) TaxID=1071381 RepID=G8BZQ8_TETPH|nr:hypothetical protein TPHA_0L00300 [Tetrapisispora phaffii CBS 4417]CCE65386.1 hypothetical protein TPHA_0L00300 [Tetrapisispora phaffii CBS 4417]